MCAMSFPLSGVEGVPDMGGEEEDPDMQIGEGLVKILVEAGSDVNTVDGVSSSAVLHRILEFPIAILPFTRCLPPPPHPPALDDTREDKRRSCWRLGF